MPPNRTTAIRFNFRDSTEAVAMRVFRIYNFCQLYSALTEWDELKTLPFWVVPFNGKLYQNLGDIPVYLLA